MNAETFLELMNTLPDEMIVTACTASYAAQKEQPPFSAAAAASAKTVLHRNPDADFRGISAPRWITAAALAACMLFAVGVGAFLISGNRDELTAQSSQTDSAVQELTAVYTETAAVTAAPATESAVTETVRLSMLQTRPYETSTAVSTVTAAVPVTETVPTQNDKAAETETAVTKIPVQTEPPAEPESSAEPAVRTTEPPAASAAETTVQTEATAAPHPVMLMTSSEEVRREGDRMIGEYQRRLAQLRGELAADAPRITLAEVTELVSSGMDFRAVYVRLHELYPYPDYIGGSGVTNIEYWLDDSGTDYISLILEQEDLVHVIHGSSREENLFEKLMN